MTDQSVRTTAPRPRIIERWFPCAEVSAASGSGWGSSNSETLLMSWFAKRPLAQSRAAVLCSLLPWPEDRDEQERVQAIIREALGACQDPSWYACRNDACDDLDCTRKTHMATRGNHDPHAHGIIDCARQDPNGGYDAARTDVLRLLAEAYPDRPAEMLDPFAGRGLIPIEAARYGQQTYAIDYSPVATLASRVLIDWPFRDWSGEPPLPFDPPPSQQDVLAVSDSKDPQRLVQDIATAQAQVQRRVEAALDEFYPDNEYGEKPWGYLWAQVIPCDGCGREFPLYGSNVLRKPSMKTKSKPADPGCSFIIQISNNGWAIEVVDGITEQPPTMHYRSGSKKGKLAWCPYPECGHGHELDEHKRLVQANFHHVELLVVADLLETGKVFRSPTEADLKALAAASERLASVHVNGMTGRPSERITPNDHDTIRAAAFGASTYGDLSVDRQNLLHATIAQSITDIANEIQQAGGSAEYASAMAGYCGAAFTRKIKRSTRGAGLQTNTASPAISHVFVNESAVGFYYDFFEGGIGKGPGTWESVSGAPTALDLLCHTDGRPSRVTRGSALSIPHRDGTLDAVVTDPPYEAMIEYSDASDLYWVWLRRALAGVNFDFAMTSDHRGVQEKAEELIVKKMHAFVGDHRTPQFYRSRIAGAFAECRRVVHDDGVVTIVFGHGDPDAWRSLLDAVADAGLVLTGAWPANTEKGGAAGSSNINTTLTLACRPAPVNRPVGRAAEVDRELRALVAERVRDVWNPSGLSFVDQKMAAAGPALEVVGRYSEVKDARGRPVDLSRYLPLARQAVTDAHDLRFDSLPLETFDRRTRFALEWVRTHGRRMQAKSEARWQRLAADMEEEEAEGLLHDIDKGTRLAFASEVSPTIVPGAATIDVALAVVAAWRESLEDAALVVRDAGIDPNDAHFWAVVGALSQNLPETDKDGAVWTTMTRQRAGLVGTVESAEFAVDTRDRTAAAADETNPQLFDVRVGDPNSLFGDMEETDR